MKRFRVSKHFYLDELIGPYTYHLEGHSLAAKAGSIDGRLIEDLEIIREHLNKPVTVNDWYNGGRYTDSGLRGVTSKIGSPFSQHRFGRAVDIKVKGMLSLEVKKEIMKIEHRLHTTRMEHHDNSPTWVHLDLKPTGKEGIYVFRP